MSLLIKYIHLNIKKRLKRVRKKDIKYSVKNLDFNLRYLLYILF